MRCEPAMIAGNNQQVSASKPVLAVRPHLGEQIFAQAAGVLDRLGVGGFQLAQDDLAALRGPVIASYALSMGNKVDSIIRLISLKTTSRATRSSTSSSDLAAFAERPRTHLDVELLHVGEINLPRGLFLRRRQRDRPRRGHQPATAE